jgi:glycerol-3-phosphate dehydrogenase
VGGKLTTAASLARECARKIGITEQQPEVECAAIAPADGIMSSLRQWAHQVAALSGISMQSALGLAEWYGRRALCVARLAAAHEALRQPLCEHTQHLVAEAVWAVQSEFALTLADILLRRVPVALAACWSSECSETAASRIAAALGWDATLTGCELEAFERERARFLMPASSAFNSIPTATRDLPAQRSA